ncbi:MAG: tyrosine-type recombinase/integrase [Hyphomicrobiaceae bacterium]
MARHFHRLSAAKVSRETKPGLYADGGGLYLRITAGKKAGKRWVFLYRRPLDGKRCEIGFGGTSAVPLAKARRKADEARALLADGKDPLAARQAAERMPTFGELADQHIKAMGPSWRNPKHRAQWEMTLKVYAKPLRDKPVNEITTADVLEVLRPIWQTIPETASRVRGRIENVLDAAKVQGFRSGENPAAWRGHLKLILPARQKLTRGHHAAMAIDDLPEFMASLRARPAVAARCLEFGGDAGDQARDQALAKRAGAGGVRLIERGDAHAGRDVLNGDVAPIRQKDRRASREAWGNSFSAHDIPRHPREHGDNAAITQGYGRQPNAVECCMPCDATG